MPLLKKTPNKQTRKNKPKNKHTKHQKIPHHWKTIKTKCYKPGKFTVKRNSHSLMETEYLKYISICPEIALQRWGGGECNSDRGTKKKKTKPNKKPS